MADHDGGRRPAAEGAVFSGLESVLADASLPAHRVLSALRNPQVTPEQLQRIGRNPVWLQSYRVRANLVLHPRTPRQVAMGLLSSLRWADLARVAAAGRLPIALRRAAEKILLLRLPELALGEKVSLARIATPPVIRGLRAEDSPLVGQALLGNDALGFEEALFLAQRPDAPEALLSALAANTRFVGRPEICRALASHPHTPRAVALRLAAGLERRDLAELISSDSVPVLVRVAAERWLSRTPPSSVVRA